ncbi:MAG: tetratricopeptide repeat protein [Aliarcobacter butzleri]|nr:tetratricopeptide repeat protein [Aliarcobacter butzleri]
MKKLFLILVILNSMVFGVTFEDGKRALLTNDYEQAFKIFDDLASKGDAKAQYGLGFMYETGKAVKMDKKEAIKWYKKSSKQGYKKAQKALDDVCSENPFICR